MADDFKALVELTKKANAKLEEIAISTAEEKSPKERIFDALPEILAAKDISKKEQAEDKKRHKEDNKNREKASKETTKPIVEEVKKSSVETAKPIVAEVKKSTILAATANSLTTSWRKQFTLSLAKIPNFTPYLENGLRQTKSFTELSKGLWTWMKKPLTIKQGREDSRTAEQKKKAERRSELLHKGIKFLGDGISKWGRMGFDKVKSGLSGLKKFALGGLALAALAFLNDPKFVKMASAFVDDIIPAIATAYDWIVEKLQKEVFPRLKKLFKDIGLVFSGKKGIFDLLNENIIAIVGISALLAPGMFFGALGLAVSGMIGAVKLVGKTTLAKSLFSNPAFLKASGLLLAVAGVVNLAADGITEWSKSKDVTKSVSASLAGTGKGWSGALSNLVSGKFSLLLGGIGLIFGPLGAAIGFVIGAIIDGMMGYIGADAIDAAISKIGDGMTKMVDDIVSFWKNFWISISLGTKALFKKLTPKEQQMKDEADLAQEIASVQGDITIQKKQMKNKPAGMPEGWHTKQGGRSFKENEELLARLTKQTPGQFKVMGGKSIAQVQDEVERLWFIKAKQEDIKRKIIADKEKLRSINNNVVNTGGNITNNQVNQVAIRNNNAILDAIYGLN